jgi:hypothetical protein
MEPELKQDLKEAGLEAVEESAKSVIESFYDLLEKYSAKSSTIAMISGMLMLAKPKLLELADDINKADNE